MKLSLLLCLFALTAPFAFAQSDSGSIRVLVADSSGASVSGTSIKLSNVATGVAVKRTAANDGYAMFTPLPPGGYLLEAAKPGFQSTRVTGISLNVDEKKLIRVTMNVATVSSTVDVSAQSEIIQSEDGSTGQVIAGEIASELPLAGRRYTELALLVPGAAESTLDPTTRGSGWFVANGNYQTQNNFVLDGVDNNQGTTNAQSLSAQVVQPSPDAIGEFKVQTNSYSAEFGRSAGAVINVALKSGTNAMHGSAWYYNRDRELAATPWLNNLTGLGKQDLQWNQFGATFGGPVIKNKFFYFVDYEGFKQDFSTAFLKTVPTAKAKSGVFYRDVKDPLTTNSALFPNRTIPASRFNALGKKLADLYPDPNLAGDIASTGLNQNNYGAAAQGKELTNKGDIKGDYTLSEKNVFSMRWSYGRQDIFRNGILPGIADGVGDQGAQFNTNQSFGGTWTRTITPSLVNFFRFGYNRTYATFAHATNDGPTAADFGFKLPSAAVLPGAGGLPLINISSYNQMGTRNFRPQFQKPELFQFIDNISWSRGKHSIRSGFETRQKVNSFLDSSRTVPSFSFNGNYTNEPLADMLLGQVYQFDANTQDVVEQHQKSYAAFFQDDWKLLPNLTLNLGVRYEYTTPYYGTKPNLNINFDLKTGQLLYAKNPTDYLISPDHGNIGPRIGLAWQPLRNRLVIRGGFGMFYSGEDMSGSDVNLPLNPPQLIPVTIVRVSGKPAPFLVSDAIPASIFENYNSSIISLRAREQDAHSAKIYQFNVAMQFQLPGRATFETAYAGNRAHNLLAEYAANQTPFGLDGSVAKNRPYPEWAQITVGATRAESWYNSLQLKYEKRLTNGLYSLVSYTFASAIDEAGAWGAGNNPQYLDQFNTDHGPNAQTPRQRLSWSNVSMLPFGRGHRIGAGWNKLTNGVLGGWQLSGITSWRSGLPVNVSLSSSGVNPATNKNYSFLNRNGGNLRPNRIGSDVTTGVDPKVDRLHFLNPAAFAVQTLNTPGNSGRNVAYGPRKFNTDVSLVKRFTVGERYSMDLRLEGFNVFNNVNFSNPSAGFGSSNFGNITSAGAARVIQAALRVRF